MKLMKQCPVRDLTFGNVGGHVWSQVKADQNFIPPFSILKRAPLWAEESRFKDTVWRWLCEGAEDWAIKEAEQLETKEGAVMSVDVQVGRATAKLMWGDVVPVLRTRSQTEVLLFEVNNENQPLSSEAIAAIGIAGRQKTGVRIIVWGPPAVVEALKKGVLLKLMEASNPLYNYKTKEVIACVPQDEAGGPRPNHVPPHGAAAGARGCQPEAHPPDHGVPRGLAAHPDWASACQPGPGWGCLHRGWFHRSALQVGCTEACR